MMHVEEYLVLRENIHYILFIEEKKRERETELYKTDQCDPISLC